MLSSASSRRGGMKYSRPARSLPNGLRIGVSAMDQSCVGAIIKNPSGRWCSRPRRTTNVRRQFALVCTSWSASPSCLHRSSAQGTVVIKLSALCSTWNPPRWTVERTPPGREPASNSVTWQPGASSRSRKAAASPEIPPPTTAIRRFSVKFIARILPNLGGFSQAGCSPVESGKTRRTSSWLAKRILLRFLSTTPQVLRQLVSSPTGS